jgi:chromate transporter
MLWSGSWFPVIVVVAALVGWTVARFRPGIFSVPGEHLSAATDRAPAIIDDDTPTPSHARVTRGRFVRTTVVSIALWLIPIGAVLATVGVANPLFAMALFFSGAAFLTFGGAYAVLPYVFHGAVSAGWATPTQMIDGLALGESTPGPLIMFVSFVGFVGGFGGEFLVTGTSLVSGVVAAIIVTWFTFLPSFYFVLAGGPFVEASRNRVAFTAPLTAINAAVAGVVLSLAITFAGTVLVPTGEPVNLFGLVVTVVAGFALFQLKRSILEVIAGGFVVGIYLGVVATFSG